MVRYLVTLFSLTVVIIVTSGLESANDFVKKGICNQNSPTQSSLSLPVAGDTIGVLLSNQWLWRLPGIDHMAHGFHMFHGQKASYPLFLFCYPNTTSTTMRLQDTYRGNTYILPDYISATSLPQCSFSMESQQYSSAQDFALNFAASIGITQETNVEAQLTRRFSVSAHNIFEFDASISAAYSTQEKNSGSLSVTTSECSTTSVQLNHRDIQSFHPEFVSDLIDANTDAELVTLVDKYGTHFYKGAVFGGKLVQISSIKSEYENRLTKVDMDSRLHLGFGGGGTLGKFSAYTNNDISASLSTELENQLEFESNTARSSIITSGGTPGSFDTSGDVSSWSEWAKSVDLIPVPIRFTLGEISEIIPEDWPELKEKYEKAVKNYIINRESAFTKTVVRDTYQFFLSTSASTQDDSGPFGIKLYDGNGQVHTSFLFEEMSAESNRHQLTMFNADKHYVFSKKYKQIPGFSGVIDLCNIPGITGGITGSGLKEVSIQYLQAESFMITDRYTNRIYSYSTAITQGADCVRLSVIPPVDQIIVNLNTRCNSTSNNDNSAVEVRLAIVGSEGTLNTNVPLSSLRTTSRDWESVSIELDVAKMKKARAISIGSIRRLNLSLYQVAESVDIEEIVISGSSLFVRYCVENQFCSLFKAVSTNSATLRLDTKVSFGMEGM